MASPRVFLLSPANCGGERAQLLSPPRARFDLAQRLRAEDGAALGEVFSFLSGLYFRGKLAYAERFGLPLVITTNAGLRPADDRVTLDTLRAAAPGARWRRPPAGLDRLRQVRRRPAVRLRRPPDVPGGVRRPRRHEPRR